MQSRLLLMSLAACAVLVIPAAWSADVVDATPASPSSIKATYTITRNGLRLGTVVETFERNEDRYKITSVTRTEGVIGFFYKDELTLVSEGRVLAAGLQPERFSYARSARPKNNFINVFDWTKRELERTLDGKQEVFALVIGAQDRLSVMYQFVVAPPRGESVTTWMSNGREAEQYLYRKRGEPTLATPAGEFITEHFQRDVKPTESKAQLWLARARSWVPVRIVFEDSAGTTLEQSLLSLTIR